MDLFLNSRLNLSGRREKQVIGKHFTVGWETMKARWRGVELPCIERADGVEPSNGGYKDEEGRDKAKALHNEMALQKVKLATATSHCEVGDSMTWSHEQVEELLAKERKGVEEIWEEAGNWKKSLSNAPRVDPTAERVPA